MRNKTLCPKVTQAVEVRGFGRLTQITLELTDYVHAFLFVSFAIFSVGGI